MTRSMLSSILVKQNIVKSAKKTQKFSPLYKSIIHYNALTWIPYKMM